MIPEWLKPVPGYEGRYWITRSGQVLNSQGAALKAYDNGNGYMIVDLRCGGRKRHHRVHRLVASAFLPNPDGLPEVNHRDEDKTNNRVGNLEWCTRIYNNRYGSVNAARSASLKLYWARKKAERSDAHA